MIRRLLAGLVAAVAATGIAVLGFAGPAAAHHCGSLSDCLPSGRSILLALAGLLFVVGVALLFAAFPPAGGALALAGGGIAGSAGAISLSTAATGAVAVTGSIALVQMAEGMPTGGSGSSSIGSGQSQPTNSAGQSYPRVNDPRTGEPISHPGSGLARVPRDQRVSWTGQDRYRFIKEWFDRGFREPQGGWSQYDIHHIRPREFGGTNDFWNLVPVRRDGVHQLFTSWWRSY